MLIIQVQTENSYSIFEARFSHHINFIIPTLSLVYMVNTLYFPKLIKFNLNLHQAL